MTRLDDGFGNAAATAMTELAASERVIERLAAHKHSPKPGRATICGDHLPAAPHPTLQGKIGGVDPDVH